jgi:hypothetical protein
MKKVQSGQGATDFGQSTGLTQDELLGRAKSTEADSPQKILSTEHDAPPTSIDDLSFERTGPAPETPPNVNMYYEAGQKPRPAPLSKDQIKDVIWANFQSAGPGFPHWIDNAAGIILERFNEQG